MSSSTKKTRVSTKKAAPTPIKAPTVYLEQFDKNRLHHIIKNADEFRPQLVKRDRADDSYDVDMFDLSRKILEQSRNGVVKVTHKQFNGRGRVFPNGGISVASLCKQIRNTICKDLYVDIDMCNAHPTILKFICEENKIDCEELTEYVENRDECFDKLIEKTECTREQAKECYLRIINGSDSTVERLPIKATKDLKNFAKEMKIIRDTLIKSMKTEFKDHTEYTKKERARDYNFEGSFINILMCDLENKILHEIINYFKSPEAAILCFDGVMLPITGAPYDLMGCQEHIKKVIGIDMVLAVKPMEKGFNIPEPEQYEDPCIWKEGEEIYYSDFLDKLAHKEEAEEEDVIKYLSSATCRIINGGSHFFLTKRRDKYGDGAQYVNQYWGEVEQIFSSKKQIGNEVVVKQIANPCFNPEKKPNATTNKPMIPLTINGVLESIINRVNIYPSYDRLVFKPFLDINPCHPKEFNLFRGLPWEHTGLWDNDRVETIRNHFYEVFANGDEALGDYLIKTEAWRVQRPNVKTRVAIVMMSQGQQCSMKSTYYSQFLIHLLGESHHLIIDQLENLTKQFNISRKGRLLTVLEEVSNFGGAHKSNDFIKNMLTSSQIRLEIKGGDEIFVDDHSNLVVLTNHEVPIKVESGDCRAVCARASSKYMGKTGYFQKMGEAFGMDKQGCLLNSVGVSSWFNYLCSIDISDFNPQDIPDTEYRNEIKERCLDPLIQYCIHAWNNGEEKINHIEYKRFIRDNSLRADPHTQKTFNTAIQSALFGGSRTRFPLKKMRALGEQTYGFSINKTQGLPVIRDYLKNQKWEFDVVDEAVVTIVSSLVSDVSDITVSDLDSDSE